MANGHHAVDRAVAFLKASLERCRADGQTVLPTVRELADSAGVCATTMSEAVQRLKRAGMLEARRGGRIRVVSPQAPGTAPAPKHSLVHERLTVRIGHDILSGRYGQEAFLPPHKTMAAEYAVDRRTLAKALRVLKQGRVIASEGRRLRVAGLRSRRGRDAIGLVAATNEDGSLVSLGPRTERLVNALENRCGQVSCRLALMPYDRQLATFRPSPVTASLLSGGPGGPPLLGTVVLANMQWRWGSAGRHTGVSEVLSQIQHLARPVALIDDSGDDRLAGSPKVRLNLCRVCTSSRAAGESAGRFLIARGHRCVVYLSAVHGALWSQQRLAGLVHAFRVSGLEGGVKVCARDHAATPRDYQGAEFDFASTMYRLVSTLVRPDPDRPDTIVGRALQELPPNVMAFPRERAILRKPVHELGMMALEHTHATAWVASGDSTAFVCQEFLRERGVRVPEDLSLISFDNRPEAFTRSITSYEFNTEAVALAAVHHVLQSPARRISAQDPTVEIQGWFVERGSSRSV